MKPYTKTGDKGSTSLIGGKRVSKNDLHLEIYGTLDELSSFIGLLKQSVTDQQYSHLERIQKTMVQINSLFANDNSQWDQEHPFDEANITWIEQLIDALCQELPPCTAFTLPGSNTCNALCHVCRCICRRAERHIYQIALFNNQQKAAIYINRLSDYFFVLSRKYEVCA